MFDNANKIFIICDIKRNIVMQSDTKRTEGQLQVRTISIPWEQHQRLKSVADASGLKIVELHRLALNNLLSYVADHGILPTPGLSEGDAV